MTADKPVNRDKQGRFVKGVCPNPNGRRVLPPEFKEYAKQAPDRLRQIAEDPKTPLRVKAEIEKWFAEMWYGKSRQQIELDGSVETTGDTVVKFEGVLDEWSK